MSWLLAAAYTLSALLLARSLTTRVDERVERSLERHGPHVPKRAPRRPLAALGRRISSPRRRQRVQRLLVAAGEDPSRADHTLGTDALLAICGAALGAATWPAVGPTAVLAACVLAPAGARFPEFLLARRAAAVRESVSAAVPDLLDLVAVSVGAGLTPRLALDRSPEMVAGPLGDELSTARRAVGLGTQWRAALRGIADRTGVGDLRRLAATIERSDRLGAPLAGRLRSLAREVRAERRALEEERARRAPVTMLFPLVFLILPAFVLAAVAPAVLVATRGL